MCRYFRTRSVLKGSLSSPLNLSRILYLFFLCTEILRSSKQYIFCTSADKKKVLKNFYSDSRILFSFFFDLWLGRNFPRWFVGAAGSIPTCCHLLSDVRLETILSPGTHEKIKEKEKGFLCSLSERITYSVLYFFYVTVYAFFFLFLDVLILYIYIYCLRVKKIWYI